MNSLQQKTVKGLFWSFLDSFGNQVIRFGFGIAIARALSPGDYGIMGMIVIFQALGNNLTESGFGTALIQKKDADENDFSTVFWFNLVAAFCIYAILYFSAGLIADFYDQPILVDVTRIAAFSIVLNALGLIHNTILIKKVDFKKQTIVRFVSVFPTGIIGVILAYKGFAVWALVIQSLAGGVFTTCGMWFIHRWRPKFVFSVTSFKSLYRYGFKVFLVSVIDVLFTRIYYPLIGKYFPVAQLGFYTKADGFYQLLVRRTAYAFGKVTFTAFSSIRNEEGRFLNSYLKTYRLLAFVMFPLVLIAIASAEPLISFFLTDKWLPVVPFMKIFFIEGFFFSLYRLNLNIFYAVGRSGFPLKVEMIKKALSVLSIFIAFPFGIAALIAGQVISSFIGFIVTTIKIKKLIDIRLFYQFSELFPLLLITVVCALFNWFIIDNYFQMTSWVLLFLKILLLSLLYIILSLIFNKKMMREFFMIFESKIPLKLKVFLK